MEYQMGQNCGQICEGKGDALEFKSSQYKQPSVIKSPESSNEPPMHFAIPIQQAPTINPVIRNRIAQLGSLIQSSYDEQEQGQKLGVYRLNNGIIYEGPWKKGKMNGKGNYYLLDGSFLEAKAVNNTLEGQCRIIYANGDYYQGNIYKNQASGKGTYMEGDCRYVGDFRDNLPHGEGVEISAQEYYKGEYEKGQRVKGLLECRQPGREFQYKGSFKRGKFNGWGEYSNSIGHYMGEFVDGAKEGNGTFTWKNGRVFKGIYRNNLKHGLGALYDQNQRLIVAGMWENDHFKA